VSDHAKPAATSQAASWDTGSHEDFYKYYEQQSLSPETLARFRAVRDLALRLLGQRPQSQPLVVLDVGCGAGTQSQFWLERGHRYWGIDINEPLILLARRRAEEQGLEIRFDVGTATALPCENASVDVCLLPELLEHVADWQGCVDEAIRVLKPGGLIYVNTSNKLCPKQQEFNLPLYSWYPGPFKRYCVRRAASDRPDLANYAKYPAVNWFSYYGLRDYLAPKGFRCLDRFDVMEVGRRGSLSRLALRATRALPPLRLIGHLLTPYTLLVGLKGQPGE
jgi:2-polyprenyl-6-hydroxyphenyl methylase/3-demethylubiquinone-9 3-methyltransferase